MENIGDRIKRLREEKGMTSYHSTLTEAIKKQEAIEADVAIQKQALGNAYNKLKSDLQIKYGVY